MREADSILKCNGLMTGVQLLHEDLVGHSEAKALSGTMVESMRGEGDLPRGDGIEAQLLGEELSDETVHVLVSAALPGSIGMSQEEVGIKGAGDSFMSGKLLAVVGRQHMDASRERRQQRDHGIRDDIGRLGRHMGNPGVAGLALVQRRQRLPMSGADDQVDFPVAKAAARNDDSWAPLDRQMIGDGAAPIAAAIAFASHLLAAQGAVQATAHVDALIDAFVADTGLSGGLEIAGDLLRAPQLSELGFGEGPSIRTNATAVLTGPHAGL